MSPALISAIIGGSCGLGGALIGGILVPYITFRLNDKTRKLELYKIVYPELFKAVQKLAADAYSLERDVWHHQNYETHTDKAIENRDLLVPKADDFILYAYSLEYLLGRVVTHEARNFGISAKESVGWQDPEVYPIANCHYTEAYGRFVEALRLTARIPVIESVFPTKPRRSVPMEDERP